MLQWELLAIDLSDAFNLKIIASPFQLLKHLRNVLLSQQYFFLCIPLSGSSLAFCLAFSTIIFAPNSSELLPLPYVASSRQALAAEQKWLTTSFSSCSTSKSNTAVKF